MYEENNNDFGQNFNENPKPSGKKILIIVLAVLGVIILFIGYHILSSNCIITSHQWVAATCSAPRTCAKCGETEGAPLEHQWVDATCTKAKTCSICSETEGIPLGHSLGEFTVTKNPTCTEAGTQEAVCSVCGDKITEDIDETGHSPGEWEIGTEATYSTDGERVRKCQTCGEIVAKESYKLSIDEKLEGMFTITSTVNNSLGRERIKTTVKNNTSSNISALKVKITFYDENGNAITSDTSWVDGLPKNQIKDTIKNFSCSYDYSSYDYSIETISVEGCPTVQYSELNDDLISYIAYGIPFRAN